MESASLFLSCGIFYIMKKVYSINNITIMYTPVVLTVYSYLCHSYMLFNVQQYKDHPELENHFIMSKDRLFRHIIQFSAMCLNQVYISVFLITSRKSCIISGLAVQTLFFKDTYFHPGIFNHLRLILCRSYRVILFFSPSSWHFLL